jgi:integrase
MTKENLIDYISKKGLEPRSTKEYMKVITLFLTTEGFIGDSKDWSSGVAQMTQKLISPEDQKMMMRKMIDFIVEYKASVSMRRAAMCQLLRYIEREDIMAKLCDRIKDMRIKRPRRLIANKALSIEEFLRVLENLDEEDKLIAKIMFESAIRANAIIYIKRDHISTVDKKIKISLSDKGRNVYAILSIGTSGELAKYFNNKNNRGVKGRIFTRSYNLFESHFKEAGIKTLNKPITSHFIKHTRKEFETHVMKRPMWEVKEILHHLNISTTFDVYGNAPEESEKWAQDVGQVFGDNKKNEEEPKLLKRVPPPL